MESICSNRGKQVLEEDFQYREQSLESDPPGIILFWQSKTVWKIHSVAHNSFSLAAGLCIYSVPRMPISSLT